MMRFYFSVTVFFIIISYVNAQSNSQSTIKPTVPSADPTTKQVESTSPKTDPTASKDEISTINSPPTEVTLVSTAKSTTELTTESTTKTTFESTTTSTAEPSSATESTSFPNIFPIPQSTSQVDDLCLCDLTTGHCDTNCCCDPDCSVDDRQLFSVCWTPPDDQFSLNYCSVDGVGVWNNSEFRTERRGGLLCIVTDNVPKRKLYQEKMTLTDQEMEQKILELKGFKWGNIGSSSDKIEQWLQEPLYRANSPIFIINSNKDIDILRLPGSLNSASCNIGKAVHFLNTDSHSCRLSSGIGGTDPCRSDVIPEDYFTNVLLFRFPPKRNRSVVVTQQSDSEKLLVPLIPRICSQSVCRPDLPLPVTGYEAQSGMCLNMIHSITYLIGYNGTQGICYAFADLQYMNGTGGERVEIRTVFQSLSEIDHPIFTKSGNPGYLKDKPILAGIVDPSGQLMQSYLFLRIFPERDNPRIVRFGQNSLDERHSDQQIDNRTEWCSNWRQLILHSFWGTDLSGWKVAAFGNTLLNQTDQWIPIHTETELVCFEQNIKSELIFIHAKTGTHDRPQVKIIGVGLRVKSSADSGVCQQTCKLVLTQTVTFVDESGPTSMILPQPPRWNIRLPKDFFYPFLLSSSSTSLFSYAIWCLCITFVRIFS